MSYLKDREIWLSNVPTGNPPAGYFWKFIQNGKVVVRDSSGNNQIMVATSGSQAITGSLTVTEGITGTVSSASYVEYSDVANKPALVSSSAQIAEFGIFATTGSNGFNGDQAITGSLTVTGQVVAQTLNVQQVTSSVVYSSGSNVFGNSLSNTQQFTGSVGVTGSLAVAGAGTFASSVTANGNSNTFGNASLSGRAVIIQAGSTNQAIRFQNSAGGDGTLFINGTSTSVDYNFNTYSVGDALVIKNNGNVGIGTPGPSNKLDIQSANGTTYAATPQLRIGGGGVNNSYAQILFSDNALSDGKISYFPAAAAENRFFSISARQTESDFVIRGNGNIGIGTSAPVSTNLNSALTIYKVHNNDSSPIPSPNAQLYGNNQSGLYLFGRNSGLTIIGADNEENQIIFANSSTVAYASINTGTGSNSTGGDMYFKVGSNGERMRITSGGLILVNSTVNQSGIPNPSIQLTGKGTSPFDQPAYHLYAHHSNNPDYTGYLTFTKSRGTTENSKTAVANGDRLGMVRFNGADGTNYIAGAEIYVDVDGTVSTGIVPSRFVFATMNTSGVTAERMRINNQGNIEIGLSANYSPRVLYLGTATNGSTAQGGQALFGGAEASQDTGHESGAASGSNYHRFIYSGAVIGSITQNGTTQVSYNTSSDYRLKTNLNPINNALQKLSELNPLKFNFISEPENEIMGFLAHEVQQVVPNAVHGQKDAIDEEGNPVYQGIDHSKLIPLLTAALQEQQTLIESLKSRIEILEQ